jgi:teichuronic acid biosynthesis glycosyltransferase TuaC
MGSDVLTASKSKKRLISFFVKYFWKETIVKSEEMANSIKKAIVIPNGVDLDIFKEMDQNEARVEVGFDDKKINIIFVATDIFTPVKNFNLAKQAVNMLSSNYVLYTVSNATKEKLSMYYSAADLLLLTSDSEGSPNVIKEALASSCPIISTDVGDVKELINGVQKCSIVERDPELIAKTIERITNINGRADGRDKIKELSIDAVSKKISNLYLNYKA